MNAVSDIWLTQLSIAKGIFCLFKEDT